MGIRRGLGVLALACCAAGAFACSKRGDEPLYSGTLQAESASVGSTAGGRVTAVLAGDGDRVKPGQALVRFDDKDQRAALASAQAQLAQAKAALADLEAGPRQADIDRATALAEQAEANYRKARLAGPQQIAAAEEGVREARAGLGRARSTADAAARDFGRTRVLYAQGAVSAQIMDRATAADREARAEVAAAQARVLTAEAQLAQMQRASVPQDIEAARRAYEAAKASLESTRSGARPDQISQARAVVESARASLDAVKARLEELVVRAPADGVVENLDLRPGDLVAPGAAVASVEEFRDPYVRIYVAQPELARFRLGARLMVRSDALPERSFTGTVEAVDAQAQFTPRDVQTAQDRAGLVFGVKVRVHDPERALRGGTTVGILPP